MTLESGFKVAKPMPFPVSALCIVLVDLEINSQLLLQHRASLPADMLPVIMDMDSNPLKP